MMSSRMDFVDDLLVSQELAPKWKHVMTHQKERKRERKISKVINSFS